jgi:hypothetical protein
MNLVLYILGFSRAVSIFQFISIWPYSRKLWCARTGCLQNSAKNGTCNKTRIGEYCSVHFRYFSGQFRLFNRFRTGHIAGNYDVQEHVACRHPPKNGIANTMSIRWILFCILSAFPGQFRFFNLFQSGHIAGNYDVQEQVACRLCQIWYFQ